MDWANERYVRLYTRDTPEMVALGWQGRFVLFELMRKVDRSGVLDTDGDLDAVADLMRIPVDVFKAGLDRLKSRGVVQINDQHQIVIPNFLDAQETPHSDRRRQQESRSRRRDEARSSRPVTDCHAVSRDVTPQPDPSQDVTLTLSDTRLSDTSHPDTRARACVSGTGESEKGAPLSAPESQGPPKLIGSLEDMRIVFNPLFLQRYQKHASWGRLGQWALNVMCDLGQQETLGRIRQAFTLSDGELREIAGFPAEKPPPVLDPGFFLKHVNRFTAQARSPPTSRLTQWEDEAMRRKYGDEDA